MQPFAIITYDDGTETIASVKDGPNHFGSSFECDVVLLADDLSENEFTVAKENGKLSLTATTNRSLSVERYGVTRKLQKDKSFRLLDGDVVHCGPVKLEFKGIMQSAGIFETALSSFFWKRSARTAGIGLGVVCLGVAALTTVLSSDRPALSAVASGIDDQSIALNEGSTPNIAVSQQSVMSNDLKGVSKIIQPEVEKNTEQGIGDVAKTSVTSTISGSEQQELADASIQRAIEVTLRMSGMDFESVKVEGGHASIVNAPNKGAWRKTFQKAVMSDVPGLRTVSFSGVDGAWEKEVEEKVAGIWAGTNQYLILTEGGVVHQNQELLEGVMFLEARSTNLLVLSVYGEKREFKLQ